MILRRSRLPGRAESVVLIVLVLSMYAALTAADWICGCFREKETN